MARISRISTGTVFSIGLNGTALAKPDNVDGINVPQGRIPQVIKDNRYPRTYYPNTERLAEDEMRITALGTGMPTQSPSNASAAFLVELGNGDAFLFDSAQFLPAFAFDVFTSISTASDFAGETVGLDGFTQTFSVPEPSTLVLLALGLAGLGVARRRAA